MLETCEDDRNWAEVRNQKEAAECEQRRQQALVDLKAERSRKEQKKKDLFEENNKKKEEADPTWRTAHCSTDCRICLSWWSFDAAEQKAAAAAVVDPARIATQAIDFFSFNFGIAGISAR